jgi:hypothetical protein
VALMLREIFDAFRNLWRFASPTEAQRAELKRFAARYLAAMLGALALGSAFFFMAIGLLRGTLLLAPYNPFPARILRALGFPRFLLNPRPEGFERSRWQMLHNLQWGVLSAAAVCFGLWILLRYGFCAQNLFCILFR